MMQDMYAADLAAGGTSYWMDRLLGRSGSDPAGTQMMSRGRALYMYGNSASVIGFGNDVAYWDEISKQKAYSIQANGVTFTEDSSKRYQTPSYWYSLFNANSAGYTLEETKFITENNVAVTNVKITNTGSAGKTLTLTADSPYATTASEDGTELTGVIDVKNKLTKLYPRISGEGMTASNGILTRTLTLGAGESVTLKFQMGFIANEIPESLTDYNRFRTYDANTAYLTQLKENNKWWADNIPYIDVADDNIKKIIYYRWWLSRFNFLDANIPGNDYQFPISVEGALGYNNAIVLTQPMHMQDLKYLRNPIYSYGDWVSAGEVSRDSLFTDNPGDPANWNNSYTQYIGDSAWQTYQVHGGPSKILKNLARYAEKDAKGQLDRFDTNNNYLINYDWGSLTGNDADSNAFHYFEKRGNIDQDRTESAFVYGNAMASSKAYELLGDTSKAAEMKTLADNIKQSFLNNLWDNSTNMFLQKDLFSSSFIPWKDANNYYAFQMDDLVPKDDPKYLESLRYWADKSEFPIFPFYTADQKDKAESVAAGVGGSNNFSNINATGNMRLFTEVLRKYPDQPYITADMYKKLMYWTGWATAINGNIQYLDNNEYWYNWDPNTQQIKGRSGIHHNILGNYNYSIIEDVAGLMPRTDSMVELAPIDIGWDHFTVNNLSYHGSDMTIVWDKPGDGTNHYLNSPEGYSLYIDGSLAFTVDKLAHVEWNPATGEVTVKDNSGATVLAKHSSSQMKAATDVDLSTNSRAVDLFQKAGVDLTQETGNAENLALKGAASASYTAADTAVEHAVNGFTISGNAYVSGSFRANPPIWGTKGSVNAQDWYQLDFGTTQTFDDVKLYFYNDKPSNSYREPSLYTLQYYDEAASSWKAVPGQYKSPTLANYNHIQFPAITAQKLRVSMTPKAGFAVGIKELQVFSTGVQAPVAVNTPPVVTAQQDSSVKIPLKANLLASVSDDGAPEGTLTSTWSMKSGPAGGQVSFVNANAANTLASFSKPGTYVLTISATDGELTTSVDITVTIDPLPNNVNLALTATPSTSYVSSWENLSGINDGYDPRNSTDKNGSAYGNWAHGSPTEWVEYDWPNPVNVNKSDVYWWTDNGGILAPTASKLQYWDGSAFVDVPNGSGNGVELNKYNTTTFSPVTTTKLRLTMTRGAQWTGILEWKVFATPTTSVLPVKVSTVQGKEPLLPSHVTKVLVDGSTTEASVIWDPITEDQLENPGSFTLTGTVDGTNVRADATVYVRVTDAVSITSIADVNVTTTLGKAPLLPAYVEATYNDGSMDNINNTVTWSTYDPELLQQPGQFTITGIVPGTSILAKANITVIDPAGAPFITSIHAVGVSTQAGTSPELPDTVTATYSDASSQSVNVVWDAVDPSKYAQAGTFTVNSKVEGTNVKAVANVTVTGGPSGTLSGPAAIQSGQELDLVYGLSEVSQEVLAQDITVAYDANKLEWVGVDDTMLNPSFVVVAQDAQPGKVRLIMANVGQGSKVVDGDILKLRFQVKGAESSGVTNVSVTPIIVANADGAENELTGAAYSGVINVIDKAALRALITEAQALYDTAEEGTGVGQYPAGSKAILLAAIHSASAVADNIDATQEQVEQAVTDLNAAVQAFKAAVVKERPGDVNHDNTVSIGDLALVVAAYGKSSEDADWAQYQAMDFDHNGTIDIVDLSALARLILE
ncbi:Ig-like domain-containing protein [Paenibacillus hexagrammi]|uniref:Ig-like domain-containing protein n=1 Tax=Paenibacillus hexagrammi TaxID=2908839 RepID=A0ABY3SQ05_9BACL|nr:Ig-like domain-containing protein [Paenibacillus sp. YPD9-1]UJF35475.1 Ig-like domain-containing protein [Paenibacillus sp. YPD9-1]